MCVKPKTDEKTDAYLEILRGLKYFQLSLRPNAMLLVFLLLFIVALIYLWIKKRYNYWNERGFLCPHSFFPFGSVNGIGQTLTVTEAIDEVYKKNKGQTPAAGMFFFLEPTIIPIDPELIKNILVRDFSSFHARGFYYNKKDDPLSAK